MQETTTSRGPAAADNPRDATASAGPLDAQTGQMLDEFFAYANELHHSLTMRGALTVGGCSCVDMDTPTCTVGKRQRLQRDSDPHHTSFHAPALGLVTDKRMTTPPYAGVLLEPAPKPHSSSWDAAAPAAPGSSSPNHQQHPQQQHPAAPGVISRWLRWGAQQPSEQQQEGQEQRQQARRPGPSLGAMAREQGSEPQAVL